MSARALRKETYIPFNVIPSISINIYVCVCVCVCVRVCVRVCMRACVRACVRVNANKEVQRTAISPPLFFVNILFFSHPDWYVKPDQNCTIK